MNRLFLSFLLPAIAAAHMVSMSSGDLKVEGDHATYELRIPAYEIAQLPTPGVTLFQNLHFRSHGVEATHTAPVCDLKDSQLVCTANYRFPSPVDVLTAECTFFSVTVPNHVHLLRVQSGDKSDQAVFDLTYTSAELRFRPAAPWETFVRESGAGFLRAVAGPAALLFLVAMALAARSSRELGLLTIALIAGEIVANTLAPRIAPNLQPRFLEAAAALTIAYLAFEILALPATGQRWLVVGILGLFQGAYFALFLVSSQYSPLNFFSGVIGGEILVLAVFWLALGRLIRIPRFRPIAASLILSVGVLWFSIRVIITR